MVMLFGTGGFVVIRFVFDSLGCWKIALSHCNLSFSFRSLLEFHIALLVLTYEIFFWKVGEIESAAPRFNHLNPKSSGLSFLGQGKQDLPRPLTTTRLRHTHLLKLLFSTRPSLETRMAVAPC